VRKFFSFPNPVNETSVRFVASCAALLALLALVLQQRWLVAALAYGFVARARAGTWGGGGAESAGMGNEVTEMRVYKGGEATSRAMLGPPPTRLWGVSPYAL